MASPAVWIAISLPCSVQACKVASTIACCSHRGAVAFLNVVAAADLCATALLACMAVLLARQRRYDAAKDVYVLLCKSIVPEDVGVDLHVWWHCAQAPPGPGPHATGAAADIARCLCVPTKEFSVEVCNSPPY